MPLRSRLLLIVAFLLLALASHGPAQGTNAPAAGQPTASQEDATIGEALQLLQKGQTEVALGKVSSVIRVDPKNLNAFILRGNIYTSQKNWDKAAGDYNTALQLDPSNFTVKFNIAEIKFQQKQYDGARADFVALKSDEENLADLVTYKVFLCDLFGGHTDAATRELAAFNQAGSNPSYYFGNAAWALFNHKTEDARGWLGSATRIYAAKKIFLYGASLKDLGYLPLPPPPPAP